MDESDVSHPEGLPPGAPVVESPRYTIHYPERRPWLPALILVAAVFLAYSRVWQAGFIWDDDSHLTQNPTIIGPLGFGDIWTSAKAVYYPLVLSSFWVQHAIWGLNPLPYHGIDVALHAACALLLWRVLLRLKIPGAWLGAAIWALHPVQVESAAWITEQKNTQSCLFYLLSILFFLRWMRISHEMEAIPPINYPPGFPRARNYSMALLCATLAILSKSSTVMLPVVLGLCAWWMEHRWRWRYAILLAPFAMVSAAASAWTVWEQKYGHNALGAEWSQSYAQRAIVAGKDIWFYLWKLIWPHPLIFIYPQWSTETNLVAFLPLAAALIVFFLLWVGRNGKLRPVFFAYAYFVVSLFPVLSFFNVYFFRYSFVGDHFQYLASIGPLALAGAAIARACEFGGASFLLIGCKTPWGKPAHVAIASGTRGSTFRIISAVLLIVLGTLTWVQCGVYYNLETLWRATLAENPAAWIAHFNLADLLVSRGRAAQAAAHYDDALADYREAEFHYRAELQIRPASVEAMGNLAGLMLIEHRNAEAIAELEELLRFDPDNAQAHGNLGVALLSAGRVDEAIMHAQSAVELSRHTDESGAGHNDAGMLNILAQTYAKAGRYPEAIEAAKMALQRAQSQSNTSLVNELTNELADYEAKAKAVP